MKGYRDLTNKVNGISNVANIPEIQVHSDLINKILHTDYLDNSGINEFEEISSLAVMLGVILAGLIMGTLSLLLGIDTFAH